MQYYFNEYTFTYDANGMRTKKEVYHCDDECEQYWTDTYEYTYNGSLLTRMYYHGAASWWTMDFRYDADGTPISVTFEHVAYEEDWEWGGYLGEETAYDCCAGTYYYVTNLQGDVIALVNEMDSWFGNGHKRFARSPSAKTKQGFIQRVNRKRRRSRR